MAANRAEAPKRVVSETCRLYSMLLSRQLSERQLMRPSFGYIQTIVKSLITETRILRNVFNPTDFDNEKRMLDKRAKIDFVQRLIDFAANHKQPVVGCVATKIVAGIDSIKANELLQALARIAQTKLSGQDAPPSRPRTFTKPIQQQQQQTPKPIISNTSTTSIQVGSAGSQRSRSGTSSSSRPSSLKSTRAHEAIKISEANVSISKNINANEPISSSLREADSKTIIVEKTETSIPKNLTLQEKQKKSSIVITSTEHDISKNMQQLRSNLKSLRNTLVDVGQMEDSLRSKLNNLVEHL